MKKRIILIIFTLLVVLNINTTIYAIERPFSNDILNEIDRSLDGSFNDYVNNINKLIKIDENEDDYYIRDTYDFKKYYKLKDINNALDNGSPHFEAASKLSTIYRDNDNRVKQILEDNYVDPKNSEFYSDSSWEKYYSDYNALKEYENKRFINLDEIDKLKQTLEKSKAELLSLETKEVRYEFISESGSSMPNDIIDLIPKTETRVKDDNIIPTNPRKDTVLVLDGKWIFKGYEKNILDDSLTFIGTWEFIPNEPAIEDNIYEVTYKFVSADGLELPEEVMNLLPDNSNVKHGKSYTSVRPDLEKVELENGRWTFIGYDKSEIKEVLENTTITGSWRYDEFVPYTVKYLQLNEDGTTSEIILAEEFKSRNILGEELKVDAKELKNFNLVDSELTQKLDSKNVYEFRYTLKDSINSQFKRDLNSKIDTAISNMKSQYDGVYFTFDNKEIGFNIKDPTLPTLNTLASALSGSGIFKELQNIDSLEYIEFGGKKYRKDEIKNADFMYTNVSGIKKAFNISDEELNGINAKIDGKWANVKTYGKSTLNGEEIKFIDNYKFVFRLVPEEDIEIQYTVNDQSMGIINREIESVKNYTGKVEGSTATANKGYKFINWTDTKGNEVSQTPKLVPTKIKATYIANFEPETYTVKFIDFDGKEIGSKVVKFNERISLDDITTPSKEGYNFRGWDFDFNNPIDSNLDIKSKWDKKSYEVKFEGISETQNIKHGEKATPPSSIPTEVGKSFVKWDFDFNTPITDAITIKPIFKDNIYKVTFEDLNTVKDVTHGKTVEPPTELPSKTGYNFKGWDFDFSKAITEETSIKALWEKKTYKVSFEGIDEVQNIKFEEKATLPTDTPVKDNYKFKGWDFDFNNPITSDITINAKWEELPKFKITFEGLDESQEVVQGKKAKKPKTQPKKDGHTFKGWNFNFEDSINSEIKIPAIWDKNEYNVTFEGLDEVQNVKYGDLATEPEAKPERDGYTFEGWLYDFITPITGNIEIKANFKGIPVYTVRFEGIETTQSVRENSNAQVPGTTPTKEGYEFKGWDFDFTKAITEETSIKALWEKKTYKVSFEGIDEVQNIKFEEKATLPSAIPVKDNYKFIGWDFDFDTPVTGETTIKALWEELPKYTVTFEGLDESQEIVQGKNATRPELEPKKDGHTFKGWDFNFDTPITSETNIPAIWDKIEYTVTFEGIDETQKVKYDEKAKAPESKPTKEDYEFIGWDFDFDNTTINENTEIKAKWNPLPKFTVTFEGLAETQEVVKGKKTTKPATEPNKEGHKFTGWDFDFENTAITESTEIKANWEKLEYTVSFEGLSEEHNQLVKYNEKASAPSAEPTKKNYVFKGWDFDFENSDIKSDTSVKANWEEKSVTFTFNYTLDGKNYELIETTNYKPNSEFPKGSEAPLIEGYIFNGWYDTSGNRKATTRQFTPRDEEDATYIAIYNVFTESQRDKEISQIKNHRLNQLKQFEKDENTHIKRGTLKARIGVVKTFYDYSDPEQSTITLKINENIINESISNHAQSSGIPYTMLYVISDYKGGQGSPSAAADKLDSVVLRFGDGSEETMLRNNFNGEYGVDYIVQNAFTSFFGKRFPNVNVLSSMLKKFRIGYSSKFTELMERSPIEVEITYKLSDGSDYRVKNKLIIESLPSSEFPK